MTTVQATSHELVGDRGIPAIGEPGRAARELPAGPPPERREPADHVLSEHTTERLDIRAASVRGLMHRYRGQPRQDSFSFVHLPEEGLTIIVVCDGVGSLKGSHEAADFVTRELPDRYLKHRDWATAVMEVNDELFAYTRTALEQDGPEWMMATTLVAVALWPTGAGLHAELAWTDDSTVWHLSAAGAWTVLATPPSTPGAVVHTGSVRALPAENPRLYRKDVTITEGSLFVMTDGVGTPLENSSQVQQTLAGWWAAPPDVFEFGREVAFARKTHMDDRTVVGVWLRVKEDSRS